MPLPLTVSCFSKIQIGFTFLVPAHPGSPGQRAVKRVCVCVWLTLFAVLNQVSLIVFQAHLIGLNSCRHTHTHPFNGPLSLTTWVSRYQKGKTNLDFTEARDSGIHWAICKSAPRSRQITTPVPHLSVFYRSDALPAAQPTASKHWWHKLLTLIDSIVKKCLDILWHRVLFCIVFCP